MKRRYLALLPIALAIFIGVRALLATPPDDEPVPLSGAASVTFPDVTDEVLVCPDGLIPVHARLTRFNSKAESLHFEVWVLDRPSEGNVLWHGTYAEFPAPKGATPVDYDFAEDLQMSPGAAYCVQVEAIADRGVVAASWFVADAR